MDNFYLYLYLITSASTVMALCIILYNEFRFYWALRNRYERIWDENIFYRKQMKRYEEKYNFLLNKELLKREPNSFVFNSKEKELKNG